MNDATWERLVDTIDIKVGIADHGRRTEPLEDRPDLTQTVEFVEFRKNGQTFRLERSTGPAIVDRKTHYSHRPGVANRVEYLYDEHETTHKVTLARQEGDEWVALELDDLGF